MLTKISKKIGGAFVSNFSVILFIPLSPYLFWAGISLVPVTHRDTTGDGCSCYTWSTDPKSGSDYRVVMFLTLAAYASILRASHGQWMRFSIKPVLLVSYPQ